MAQSTDRARVVLAALVACALVVLPYPGGSTAAGLAAVSLVVLALASALRSAPRPMVLLLVPVVGHPVAGEPGPPLLRSRTTDPTHHPLAPRAPGLG